ncbi:hypothetical protein BU23DRAFT_559324 [Bimuria novae-zelandiae CBS 107.79]|uniref:C2H2-type domain-containing protein n=1 Tax=Bimuria novae-zelandiae CBS 107.79 TaxID=1447943 RepID=A0A6A5US56_9PLEO|nr:hypothetical protein BU23DRAFT_559324 [Bimuria novae-zelandiae CBS 107.79]
MGLITLVRGFKVSVSDFDVFLRANGLPPIGGGYQPSPKEAEDIAKLFRVHGIDCEVRVFVPYATGFDRSRHLFVCCDWIHVLVTRDIEGVLQEPVPPAFEQMHDSLGAESGVSRYIVYNEEEFSYTPEEVIKRNMAPIECGVCDAVFSLWQNRMRHRHDEHGISEDQNPLPDC